MKHSLFLIWTTTIVLMLVACSPTAAVDKLRQEVQAQTQPDPEPPSSSPDRTDTDTETQAKIQAVIARANFEQEQAFVARDPTIMKNSSTDRYYREMAQTNQDLRDGEVTGIKLLGIEWGPVTVRRNAAVATTWETWSTTFADGRTRETRDRNNYRLILQDGAWKIDGDTHGGDDRSAPSDTRRT